MSKNVFTWRITLVNQGIETIRVMRRRKIVHEGTYPAGFAMHLQVGDSVLMKRSGAHWRKKFGLVIYKGQPALQFGEHYGAPKQYVWLHTLPHIPKVTWRGRPRKESRYDQLSVGES